jgi:hypothetical protein
MFPIFCWKSDILFRKKVPDFFWEIFFIFYRKKCSRLFQGNSFSILDKINFRSFFLNESCRYFSGKTSVILFEKKFPIFSGKKFSIFCRKKFLIFNSEKNSPIFLEKVSNFIGKKFLIF